MGNEIKQIGVELCSTPLTQLINIYKKEIDELGAMDNPLANDIRDIRKKQLEEAIKAAELLKPIEELQIKLAYQHGHNAGFYGENMDDKKYFENQIGN